jgi:hypothetical protein
VAGDHAETTVHHEGVWVHLLDRLGGGVEEAYVIGGGALPEAVIRMQCGKGGIEVRCDHHVVSVASMSGNVSTQWAANSSPLQDTRAGNEFAKDKLFLHWTASAQINRPRLPDSMAEP